jgi:hypothetical protein
MLGSTAICRAVLFASSNAGRLASPSPFSLNRCQSAVLAAECLSRMAGRKRTITRLPKALTLVASSLRYLPRASWQTRMEVGQAGASSAFPRASPRALRSRARAKSPEIVSSSEKFATALGALSKSPSAIDPDPATIRKLKRTARNSRLLDVFFQKFTGQS